jgi:AcrR family transcriptional regulator
MSTMQAGNLEPVPAHRRLRRSSEETKAHLLAVAYQLFYKRGIHSVAVDEIARSAEMAPTTMYRAFESKDALVAGYARSVDDYWRAWFTEATSKATNPADQIRAVFAALAEVVGSPEHRGCPFMMLLAEYPDADHPAHRVSVANKQWARQQLGALCQAAGFSDPNQTADQLTIVLDGAYANNQSLGPDGPVNATMPLVELIITSSLR